MSHERTTSPEMVEPLNGLVLCELEGTPEDPNSRIITPETYKPRADRAKVLAVSPGAHGPDGNLIAPQCAKGDRVIINPYAITRVLTSNDQMSQAQGSPLAKPGDRILIAQNQILGRVT